MQKSLNHLSNSKLSKRQKDRKAWRDMSRKLLNTIRTNYKQPTLKEDEKKMIEWFRDKAKSNIQKFEALIDFIKTEESALGYKEYMNIRRGKSTLNFDQFKVKISKDLAKLN